VGNLSVGGSGKTPHVIYLAKQLKNEYNLAILSRGYRRQTKGFRWVQSDDDPILCGDEPAEIKAHLPDIPLAVDGNRRRGVLEILQNLNPKPDLILMDDGFQHRQIRPSFSILLTRSDQLFTQDRLLPSGRLREHKKEIKRAQAIIVSNSQLNEQGNNKPFEINLPIPIYHSFYSYSSCDPNAFATHFSRQTPSSPYLSPLTSVLLVTSVASPTSLQQYIQEKGCSFTSLRYRDHHHYDMRDIRKILSTFTAINSEKKTIVTTGKDWVKLSRFEAIHQLPVVIVQAEPNFTGQKEVELLKQIKDHVATHT